MMGEKKPMKINFLYLNKIDYLKLSLIFVLTLLLVCCVSKTESDFDYYLNEFLSSEEFRKSNLADSIGGYSSDHINPMDTSSSTIDLKWSNNKEVIEYLNLFCSDYLKKKDKFMKEIKKTKKLVTVDYEIPGSGYFTTLKFINKKGNWKLVYFLYHNL